ncbi:MAG: class I SAM-dependent methyltransferase [Bacilli bacterium]
MTRFDMVADRYDVFCQTPLGQFVDDVERALVWELLAPAPGETMGDLGCGTGAYATALAQAGLHVIGVDESPDMLAKARAKSLTAGSASFLQADLAALPLGSATLDAVLLQVTLEFVADPTVVLREAFRVLKPNGRLVLGLIHGSGPWARHYRARAEGDAASIYRHAHFFTLKEVRDLLGTAPTAVRAGLYVGPDEFRTRDGAWTLERQRRATGTLAAAGYLAVRCDR